LLIAGAANNVDTDSSGSAEAGAKDEDGGGEEEIDESFVALKNQLKAVVDRSDSTEADHLLALNALKGHVLRDGCVYDEDLAVILEDLQHSTNTEEVHEAAISIINCFPFGVEGKINCSSLPYYIDRSDLRALLCTNFYFCFDLS
jgi:hypothetical protein